MKEKGLTKPNWRKPKTKWWKVLGMSGLKNEVFGWKYRKSTLFSLGIRKKILTLRANLFLQNKIGVLGEVFALIFCAINGKY